MHKPKSTLALLQHQMNWWGNFNLNHFEKVLEAKELVESRVEIEETIIFLPAFSGPKPTIWNNLNWLKIHK